MPDRAALYTVVYPGVESFLPAWYASVRTQTDREFDLWISVDGVLPDAMRGAMGGGDEARWLVAAEGASPAALRSAALDRLTAEYEAVILVDSDDLLEVTRVEAARKGLASADLVGCALRVADMDGTPLGPILTPAEASPDWGTLLSRHNVFGLSNTAFRAETLRACLPIPPEAVLIDWLLAVRAWAEGAVLAFDREPRMRYRQHQANTARVLPPFSEGYVLRATDLVAGHYRCLRESVGAIPADRRQRLREAEAAVLTFRRAVRQSPAILRRYVDDLNQLEPQYVWWWCVANPALEAVWSN
jgi:hypothetical protein